VSSKDFGDGMAPLPIVTMKEAVNSFKTVWQPPSERPSGTVRTAIALGRQLLWQSEGRATKDGRPRTGDQVFGVKTISFQLSREMFVGRMSRNGGEFYYKALCIVAGRDFNTIVQQIGNYSLADLTNMCRKYEYKRTKHILTVVPSVFS
jgi:hypothetical protein